jgi:AAHS family 4-hydroxybenzoate transporter-like MFS transporter
LAKQNLQQLIDDGPLGAYQLVTILICGMIGLLDGFDAQSIAFVAPSIAREWGIAPGSFGPIFAAGLIGGLLGALPFGAIADQMGRRRCLMIVLAVIAAGTLATPFTRSPEALLACRLLSGLGLGGVLPCIVALTMEYAPKRMRVFTATAMFCSFPLGAVLGATMAGALITEHNWRSVFWIGGAAPLLLLPVVALRLPESLAWLARRGREAEVTRIVRRLARQDAWDGDLDIAFEPQRPGGSLLEVARNGRGYVTLLYCMAFFVSLLLSYLLVNWVPTIAVQSGATIRQGALAAAMLNLAGIIGSLSIARISDKLAPNAVVAGGYGLGAVGVLGLSVMATFSPPIFLFSFVAGFFCIGAQMTLISLSSAYYPVEVRASSIAVIGGVGRLGSVAGPLLGGFLVGAHNPSQTLAWTTAACASIACVAIWLAHQHQSRPRKLAGLSHESEHWTKGGT